VLVIAVDQLRADRLDARLPGGLGRIARSGRVFTDARLEHAFTETCPGHVTMLTGRQPGPAGITGNTDVDGDPLELVYCLEDRTAVGAILGRSGRTPPAEGRSPRRLHATTLGDWLRAARPAARVYAVSAKDRAAIALGGQRPNGAYWLDRGGSGAMTTSRYYRDRLPGWLARWRVGPLLAPVPATWTHASGDPPNGARPDAYPGEVTRWSTTSPHPVKPEGDTAGSLDAFAVTPFLDQRTLDFARELVVEEALGVRGETDLLAISLSGTDYVGHFYGPWSQESRDALLRLDADLGRFLDFLDERLGPGRVLLALTADHGVLPLPEYLARQGGGCPVAGGRVSPAPIDAGLAAHLDAVFGPPAAGTGPGWLLRDGFEIYLRDARVAAAGVPRERVVEVADAWLEQQPGVARVWRGADIDAGLGSEPMLTRYRNSRVPGRGGDLVIEPAYGCLLSPWPAGTSHGSPHDYDLDVPVVFMGPGVEPGRVSGRAAPVDIGPTLAQAIGVAAPEGLEGRVLPLGGEPDDGS
jgi:arylsulfatase A-like enzyme